MTFKCCNKLGHIQGLCRRSRWPNIVSALDSPSKGSVRVLAWVIVLCSWVRPLTLTVPLWVLVNCQGNLTKCWGGGGGVTCDGLASNPGGVAILLVASSCSCSPFCYYCYYFMLQKPGLKLQRCGPLGLCAEILGVQYIKGKSTPGCHLMLTIRESLR